jgi:hypothetical protein
MRYGLFLWLALVLVLGRLPGLTLAQAQAVPDAASASSAAGSSPVADPFKESSEFNHHAAGWALIGVGLLVLAGYRLPQIRILPYLWPALFLLAGFFLALWSDGEMWPRGNVAWTWLLHHDAEARQHKIYALLLIAMGTVEYLRARGSLSRFWRAFAFPILAVVGASLLLIHDHTQGSGVHSPEVRAYLVDPARGPDGRPIAASPPDSMPGMDHSNMAMDHSAMDHSAMDHSEMNHSAMNPETADPAAAGMDHSAMPESSANTPSPASHHHHMTPSMLLVEREHFWFMIVGLGIAIFKLISDADIWRRSFVQYVWPSGMVLLGVLLVLYRE